MASIVLSLSDFPGWLRRKQKQLPTVARDALRLAAKTEGMRVIQEVISATTPQPVDRGTYRRGWRARNVPGGVAVYNPTLYASVIEHGRRPGGKPPPTKLIARWVLRKGLVKDVRGKAKQRRAARAFAFAIARSIAKKGQKGQHILEHAVKRMRPLFQQAVNTALRTALDSE